ncbi:MAG: Rpn family recombination-promoting nuclease/putative transposase, partial [Cyanobacteria bacterium J06648_11]
RLDVVFKLLFAAERNRRLLITLLNDVLHPEHPIVSVDVVNPEIEKDAPDDRGVILDILVAHDDGTRSNIEMQAQDRGATEKRALYHWARMYRDGLGRGDDFAELNPCRVIFFLSYRLLPGERLHSTFQALEVHDGSRLSDDFAVHTVELPKLSGVVDAKDTGVQAWARFLAADSDEERQRVAMENTIINEANQALTQLSRDPEAQRLARWREDQLRLYRVEMTAAQRTARQKGLEEGLEKGREEGLEKGQLAGRQSEAREVIRSLCKAFDIEWVDGYEEHIQNATLDQLGLLREHILKLRSWPD